MGGMENVVSSQFQRSAEMCEYSLGSSIGCEEYLGLYLSVRKVYMRGSVLGWELINIEAMKK